MSEYYDKNLTYNIVRQNVNLLEKKEFNMGLYDHSFSLFMKKANMTSLSLRIFLHSLQTSGQRLLIVLIVSHL